MEIDKKLLAKHFGRSAVSYDAATPVQAVMAAALLRRARAALRHRPVRRILELGCGTGRLTRQLLAAFPAAHVTALDLAPEMIALARRQTADPRVTWRVADAEAWVPRTRARYDLIVGNAVAQWFTAPARTLAACRRRLAPGGCLALATLGPGTFGELRAAFAAAYRATGRPPQPHVLELRPARAYAALLPGARRVAATRQRLVYPDVRAFLRTVQQSGATLATLTPARLDRTVYAAMTAAYAQRFAAPGGVVATYHILYVLAPAAGPPPR